MIEYKKAIFITMIEYFSVLAVHIIYAWFCCSNRQFDQVMLWCAIVYTITLGGCILFWQTEWKVVSFIFGSVILSTHYIGYILHTLHYSVLIFIVTACIITMFLNRKYVLVYGGITTGFLIFFEIFHYNIISETMPSVLLYFFYVCCYVLGLFNIFWLVKQANKYLEKVEMANQSKNMFLAAMSHEIRTPMNAVCSLSEKILEDPTSENVPGYAENIILSSNILLSMTNSILDYSKMESGQFHIVPMPYRTSDMIQEVVNMIKVKLINQDVDFILIKDKKIPEWLLGDEFRIRQVLINILSNAVKYTEKGKITFQIEWNGNEKDGTLIFKIADTGFGIRKRDMGRLFDSFVRFDYESSRKIEGAGLGLSICQQLVTLMDGTIDVDSTYGIGSTFAVKLPQIIGKKGKRIKAPGSKVLIVDDTKVNRAHLEGLLHNYEIQTDIAVDGYDCLNKMEEYTYDMIFMDYLMPGMDGLETIRAIRSRPEKYYQTVPIVVLTSGAEEELKTDFLDAGIQGYLEKPIEIDLLELVLLHDLPSKYLIEETYDE